MATQAALMNMHNNLRGCIPCNRGYIIDDTTRVYGTAHPIDKGQSVKLIDGKRHLHSYKKDGFSETVLGGKETDAEGWVTRRKRQVVKIQKMTPCPNEIADNGNCQLRWDKEHRKLHYHFAHIEFTSGKLNFAEDGRPYCRWKTKGRKPCWEKDSEEHCTTFAHLY